RAVVALTLSSLFVALVAGGTAYFLLRDEDGNRAKPGPQQPTTSTLSSPSPATGPGAPPPSKEVPEKYLGTWLATFDTADGTNTRTMTITQGARGERVMNLTGTSPTYDCAWSASLRSPGPPLELGPTQVVSGDPGKCSPGQWSRLEMTADGTIVRELVGSGGVPLTYMKTDY
ncbi:serine/threonine protein kinase, partial [Streptomyces sp. NPDC055078]